MYLTYMHVTRRDIVIYKFSIYNIYNSKFSQI
jgi:hypothetical protein